MVAVSRSHGTLPEYRRGTGRSGEIRGSIPLETSHGIMVDFDDSSDKSIEGARSKQIRLEPPAHPIALEGLGSWLQKQRAGS